MNTILTEFGQYCNIDNVDNVNRIYRDAKFIVMIKQF